MFTKWIINRIIKSIIKELPELKEKALVIFDEHKEELIAKVKDVIKKAIVKFVNEKLG